MDNLIASDVQLLKEVASTLMWVVVSAVLIMFFYLFTVMRVDGSKLIELECQRLKKASVFITLRITWLRALVWLQSVSFCTEKKVCENCTNTYRTFIYIQGEKYPPCRMYLNKDFVREQALKQET